MLGSSDRSLHILLKPGGSSLSPTIVGLKCGFVFVYVRSCVRQVCRMCCVYHLRFLLDVTAVAVGAGT